eukprot:364457-Chlamydomonas_euryale.AAC.4
MAGFPWWTQTGDNVGSRGEKRETMWVRGKRERWAVLPHAQPHSAQCKRDRLTQEEREKSYKLLSLSHLCGIPHNWGPLVDW